MGNLPQIFNYETAQIRVIAKDGEPWFAAKDVCEVLDITWSGSKTLDRISDNHKGVVNFTTPGGNQEMLGVDESGLYKLIMRSNKPEAETFQDWITDEVIPTIRKTGSYTAPMTIEDMIIAQAQSVKELKAEVKEIGVTSEYAKEQAELANKRINELDNVDTIGDTRQRLVKAVQRYAERNGYTYSQGWKDFRQAFNTAFHTNLTARRKYYMESRNIKSMTVPEYLEATNQLPDALRVANKMLQPTRGFAVV